MVNFFLCDRKYAYVRAFLYSWKYEWFSGKILHVADAVCYTSKHLCCVGVLVCREICAQIYIYKIYEKVNMTIKFSLACRSLISCSGNIYIIYIYVHIYVFAIILM